MLKFTVLRLGIFFVCLGLLWLVGLRSPDQLFLLLLLAAVISMVISFFALKGPRGELSEKIDARVNRALARHKAASEDEQAEDQEADSAP
ncbi:MAG: DUF4229 domain-containing protein [Dermatophilaceae bacterium]